MKAIIATIALLYSLCQHLTLISSCKINAFQLTRIINDGRSVLMFSPDGFNKDVFATATCKNQHTDSSKCNIQLATYNPYRQRSCEVILDDARLTGLLPFERLVPLDTDKAVFLWTPSPSKLRLIIVHFDDNCRVYEAEITNTEEKPAELFADVVVSFDNSTFDVSVMNPKLCGKERYCRVRFDAKAQRIGEPILWMSKLSLGITLAYSAWNEGYFIKRLNFATLVPTVSFVDLQGNERLMRSYPSTNDYATLNWVATSWAYGIFTACLERLGTCEQFDLQNKTILAPVNVIKSPTMNTAVHTLPKGGFLHFSEPTSERKEYRVTKYDSTGKEVGTVDIEGIGFVAQKGDLVTMAQVYESKEGKYCVSIVCTIPQTGKEIKGIEEIQFNVACFDNKDFCRLTFE